jgi:NAD(P)-dependent dehydrogenase (short-subunit alcohol dehydrogenase family)
MMIADLSDRIALITGCTGGIGSAISAALSEAGATIVGADIAADDIGAKWSKSLGGPAAYHRVDVTSEEDWARMIAAVEANFGRLDILVHNAGIVVVEKLEETSLVDWRRQMAINVDGPFLGTKAAIRLMAKSGQDLPFGASIVMISSIAGINGTPLHTGYCASKGAVRLFGKACALEFSALGYKVRVNTIHPGGVNTGMVNHIMQRFVDNGFFKNVDEANLGSIAAHPIGRMAEPSDVAKAVRYLASDESGFMHGSEMVVDGGFTAR